MHVYRTGGYQFARICNSVAGMRRSCTWFSLVWMSSAGAFGGEKRRGSSGFRDFRTSNGISVSR